MFSRFEYWVFFDIVCFVDIKLYKFGNMLICCFVVLKKEKNSESIECVCNIKWMNLEYVLESKNLIVLV